MASEPNPILETVSHVLEPLGDGKAEVMQWVAEFLQTCPLTAYVCAKGEPGDVDWHEADAQHPQPWTSPKAFEFRIADPDPLDPTYTIFAIFHWYAAGAFVVCSFKATLLEDGGAAGTYLRNVVFEPRFSSGPVSLEALKSDLHYHLTATPWDDLEDDDGGPVATAAPIPNGRRALPGATS